REGVTGSAIANGVTISRWRYGRSITARVLGGCTAAGIGEQRSGSAAGTASRNQHIREGRSVPAPLLARRPIGRIELQIRRLVIERETTIDPSTAAGCQIDATGQ